MMIESSTIENYANKTPRTLNTNPASTTTSTQSIKIKTSNALNKSINKTLSSKGITGGIIIGETTSNDLTSFLQSTSSSAGTTTTNQLNETHTLNESSKAISSSQPAMQQQSTHNNKYKLPCKSSSYNTKDICNNLYEIDEQLNKDLLVDYFFCDNYQLDTNTTQPSPPTATVTTAATNNTNSNSNTGQGGNNNKLVVVWSNNHSSNTNLYKSVNTNKIVELNDWHDGLNEWNLTHPYPSLKTYVNTLNKRRNKRNDIEFDEDVGLHFPSAFKQQLNQIKQKQIQKEQELEGFDYLPPHISHNSNNTNLNILNNNVASTLLFKELHKLVNSTNSNSNNYYYYHNHNHSQSNNNNNGTSNAPTPAISNNTNTANIVNSNSNNINNNNNNTASNPSTTSNPSSTTNATNSNNNNNNNINIFHSNSANFMNNSALGELNGSGLNVTKRQSSANSNLSKKLLSIKPPVSMPQSSNANNIINSSVISSAINSINNPANLLYSQLQLRSDELDRVKTNTSASSSNGQQNRFNKNFNNTNNINFGDLLKTHKTPHDIYANDDLDIINIKKSTFNSKNSMEYNDQSRIESGVDRADSNYQRVNQNGNYINSSNNQQQSQRKMPKSESDSSFKQGIRINGNSFEYAQDVLNGMHDKTTANNSNTKILKVTAAQIAFATQNASNINNNNGTNSTTNYNTNNVLFDPNLTSSAYQPGVFTNYRSNLNSGNPNFYIDGENILNERQLSNVNDLNGPLFYISNSLSQVKPPPKATTPNNNNRNFKANIIQNQLAINSNSASLAIVKPLSTSNMNNTANNLKQLSEQHQHSTQNLTANTHSHNNLNSNSELSNTPATTSLPPIISGKRINLPLGPHRYL